jgi:hypothetical protein
METLIFYNEKINSYYKEYNCKEKYKQNNANVNIFVLMMNNHIPIKI